MLTALLPIALADPASVLVSALQPRNDEATGLSSLLEGFLAQELAKNPEFQVLRVEDAPAFDVYPARTWMEGCPRGEIVGCSLVLGQRAGASWAVTGTVQSLVEGTRVTIDIIDVEGSRTVLSFQSELDAGNDEAFAEGVAKVLAAAIGGELGERDIRDGDDPDPSDDLAVARQLDELARETGGVTAVVTRSNRLIERPAYTEEDLARAITREGGNPWERLGMTASEYMRYKNSGRTLFEWRERSMGRAGQVLVRPWVGFLRGPYGGEYYGRYAYDVVGGQLQVVDAYSTQAVQDGGGGAGGIAAAYGVFPALEVGAYLGAVSGSYELDVDQSTVGQERGAVAPVVRGDSTLVFGPRVLVAPFPVSQVRPVVGGGLMLARVTGAAEMQEIPAELVSWPGSFVLLAEGVAGVEARIARTVDVYAQVPVHVLVVGETLHTERTGFQDEVDIVEPAVAGPVGAGFLVGIQVRIGGRAPPDTTRYEEFDEEPEE